MIGWRYREAQSRQFAGIGLLGEPVLAGQERARAGKSGQSQSQSAFRRCVVGIESVGIERVFLGVKRPVRALVGIFVPYQVWPLKTFWGGRFY